MWFVRACKQATPVLGISIARLDRVFNVGQTSCMSLNDSYPVVCVGGLLMVA